MSVYLIFFRRIIEGYGEIVIELLYIHIPVIFIIFIYVFLTFYTLQLGQNEIIF